MGGGLQQEEELAPCDPPIPVWPGAEGTRPGRLHPNSLSCLAPLTWSRHVPAPLALAAPAAAAASVQWGGVLG